MTFTLFGSVLSQPSEPLTLLAEAQGGGFAAISNILLPVLLIGIFYFVLIRPQQKRQREVEDWRRQIKQGDEVVTSGGLWARVSSANEKSRYVVVELQDKVRVKVLREHIVGKAPSADLSSGTDTAK